MKKCFLFFIITAAVFLALGSCNDPVFYTISQEVEPIEPRINGAPTNFVVFQNTMYTASGSTIHSYTKENGWKTGPNPGGKILQLASTENYLYALCNEGLGVNTILKQYDNSTWKILNMESSSPGRLQYIYAAKDRLFAGASYYNVFSIMYVDENAPANAALKDLLLEGKERALGEISGAAFDGTNYYLCTTGTGIFRTADPASGAALLGGSGIHFTGIIDIDGSTIVSISRNGEIYTVGDSINRFESISMGNRMSTGALAVWVDKDDSSRRLLLAGRQDRLDYSIDSGYTYGYLELQLDGNAIMSGSVYTEPGLNFPSSIINGDNERYTSTIGKYPVNHILQAPVEVDSEMTLFAATQKNGIFSYRDRNPWQWNAEE